MQNMLSRLEDVFLWMITKSMHCFFFSSCYEIKTGLQVTVGENEVFLCILLESWSLQSPPGYAYFGCFNLTAKCSLSSWSKLQWEGVSTAVTFRAYRPCPYLVSLSQPSPEIGVSLQARVGHLNLQMDRNSTGDDLMQVVDLPTPKY